jgi:hypothetical protein
MDDRDEDRDLDRDRDLPESIRRRLEAMVPEMVKKTFAAGMGALFSTEEGLRKLAKEINVPDVAGVAGYLATTADTTKDRIVEIIAREVREFLTTVNLGEEIAKMLTALSFEVKTEIRFIPNSERYSGVEPDVKAAVRVKRSDRGKKRATTPKDRPDEARAGRPRPEPVDQDKPGDDRPRRRFWRRGAEGEAEGPGDPGGPDDDDGGDET